MNAKLTKMKLENIDYGSKMKKKYLKNYQREKGNKL